MAPDLGPDWSQGGESGSDPHCRASCPASLGGRRVVERMWCFLEWHAPKEVQPWITRTTARRRVGSTSTGWRSGLPRHRPTSRRVSSPQGTPRTPRGRATPTRSPPPIPAIVSGCQGRRFRRGSPPSCRTGLWPQGVAGPACGPRALAWNPFGVKQGAGRALFVFTPKALYSKAKGRAAHPGGVARSQGSRSAPGAVGRSHAHPGANGRSGNALGPQAGHRIDPAGGILPMMRQSPR
jgi:hypothetical protein